MYSGLLYVPTISHRMPLHIKNNKEFVNQRLEKVIHFIPDIPQRIDKTFIKLQFIHRQQLAESSAKNLKDF